MVPPLLIALLLLDITVIRITIRKIYATVKATSRSRIFEFNDAWCNFETRLHVTEAVNGCCTKSFITFV